MRIKRAGDIEWRDLPKIEHPFFARSQIERAFFDCHGSRRVGGIDQMLRDGCHYPHGLSRDQWRLDRLLKQVERGDLFLVESKTGREIDLAKEGKDLLPLSNPAQLQGAQSVWDSQAAAAAVSTIMALGSRFRPVVRNPKEFAAGLKRALTHTASEASCARCRVGTPWAMPCKIRTIRNSRDGYLATGLP